MNLIKSNEEQFKILTSQDIHIRNNCSNLNNTPEQKTMATKARKKHEAAKARLLREHSELIIDKKLLVKQHQDKVLEKSVLTKEKKIREQQLQENQLMNVVNNIRIREEACETPRQKALRDKLQNDKH